MTSEQVYEGGRNAPSDEYNQTLSGGGNTGITSGIEVEISALPDVDPNTLWCSPFGDSEGQNGNKYSTSLRGLSNELMVDLMSQLSSQGTVYELAPILSKVHSLFVKSWGRNNHTFRQFWSLMTIESRENFLMDVSPFLCYADDDRYCVLNGAKVYVRDTGETYDRLMLLLPYMNVCSLANGEHDLVWLFDQVSSWNLAMEAADMVARFRRMYSNQCDEQNRTHIRRSLSLIFPFSSLFSEQEKQKYARQKKLKKGDLIVLNFPKVEESCDGKFSVPVRCNDPEAVMKGSHRSDDSRPFFKDAHGGFRANLWNAGAISLPFENEEVVKALHFVLLNVSQWLDEFRVEYLGRSEKLSNPFKSCAYCQDQDEDVKKRFCSACGLAVYCSSQCQKAHWPRHKVACRAVTEPKTQQTQVKEDEG
jgi:hypothetical protein